MDGTKQTKSHVDGGMEERVKHAHTQGKIQRVCVEEQSIPTRVALGLVGYQFRLYIPLKSII